MLMLINQTIWRRMDWMARYTMELGELLQQWTPDKNIWDLSDMIDIIKNSRDRLFSSSYPIWDEAYRDVLNTKIITHYFYREIGFATPSQFMFKLTNKMQEIMPYYNQLYETQMDTSVLLRDTAITEEYKEEAGNTADESTKEQTTDKDGHERGVQTTNLSEGSVDVANKGTSEQHNTTKGDVSDSGKDTAVADYNSSTKHNLNSTATTQYGRTDTKGGTDTNTTDGTVVDRFSDTPQGGLTGVRNDNYLTTADIKDDDTTVTARYNSNTTASGKDSVANTGFTEDVKTGADTTTTAYGKSTTTNMRDDTTAESTDTSSTASTDKSDITTTEQYLAEKTGIRDIGRQTKGDSHMSYTKKISGRSGGSYVDEMLKLRDAILNIDMMIIKELEVLFMGLY